jgi:HJR/Mrr/RecB family endonuclease
MDTESLETDLRTAVGLLPPSAIEKLAELLNYAFANLETLKAIFPQVTDLLKRHVMAVAIDLQFDPKAGEEVEAVLRKVFSEVGIKPTVTGHDGAPYAHEDPSTLAGK